MFKTKKDVDKHISDILRKIKSEPERHLRGFCFAKLYYAIKEYETALKYLACFISVKSKHAGSHKLMGQILEDMKQYEKALQSYKRSLELDETQKDLVLKVCDLYCRVPVDIDRGRYWADRAQLLFSHHNIIFRLRETLMKADGESNSNELENLIASELVARPKDMTLRIKLLKLYLDTERVDMAYDHAIKVEEHQLFKNSYDWYCCLEDVFEAYMEDEHHVPDIEFFMHLLSCNDHLIHLSLRNRSIADTSDILVRFDEYLKKAEDSIKDTNAAWQEVFNHMQGQLYFHFATFIIKRAKLDQGKWKESNRIAAALLMTALNFEPNLKASLPKCDSEVIEKMIKACRHQAAYRLSQAGHIVISMSSDTKNWCDLIKQQCCSVQMKERIYQRIASKSNAKCNSNNSYFLTSNEFVDVEFKIPTNNNLMPFDEDCCKKNPDNLQLFVWLCLQILENDHSEDSDVYRFATVAFSDVQKSCSNESLSRGGHPETLCQLDMQAFLIATVKSLRSIRQHRQSILMNSSDKPLYLPLIISDYLCSSEQEKWWNSTYQLLNNKLKSPVGELRRIVQHGLEVIRGSGNHGLSVTLMCTLAKYFYTPPAEVSPSEQDYLERAIHYWNLAVSSLERLLSNLTLRYPKERLFADSTPEPSNVSIKSLLNEGYMCLGEYFYQKEEYEKCSKMFQSVNTPEAALKQAVVFKILAGLEIEGKLLSEVTSEVVECHNALLVRARDSCYLSLDRMRGQEKETLVSELNLELKEIEAKLQGIGNFSRENSVLEESAVPDVSKVNHSTPKKCPTPKQVVQSSPKRLDLQIKNLASGQEEMIKSIMHQNRALIEANRAIVEELKINKSVVEQLKDEMVELHNDLAELRISKESEGKGRGKIYPNGEEFNDNYVEDEYVGIPEVYQPQNQSYSRSGFMMNYEDGMYRQMPEHRVSAHTPSNNGYLPQINYHLPMFRIPPPTAYGNQSYMPPGNFPSQFHHPLQDPHGSFSMTHPQNSSLPTLGNVPAGAVAPLNSTPVPDLSAKSTYPKQTDNLNVSSNASSSVANPPTPAAHPFQILMPANTQTTPKSSLVLNISENKTSISQSQGIPVNRSLNYSSDREVNVPKSPDFKPIIPLPDEVEVVTGEEEETEMFTDHAKLYRFHSGEWKERGTGVVKILVNSNSKQARFLMRRDQVFRVCANHRLVSGMTLISKTDYKNSWVWSAQDFADQEPNMEKFCIRFKEESCSNNFKVIFDNCVKQYGNTSSDPVVGSPQKPMATIFGGLSNFTFTARLFRFDNNVWKDHGVGSLEVSIDQSLQKATIKMRSNESSQVIGCHHILSCMKLSSNLKGSKNIWHWTALDSTDPTSISKKFYAIFDNEAKAMEFVKVFSDCKEKYGKISPQMITDADISKQGSSLIILSSIKLKIKIASDLKMISQAFATLFIHEHVACLQICDGSKNSIIVLKLDFNLTLSKINELEVGYFVACSKNISGPFSLLFENHEMASKFYNLVAKCSHLYGVKSADIVKFSCKAQFFEKCNNSWKDHGSTVVKVCENSELMKGYIDLTIDGNKKINIKHELNSNTVLLSNIFQSVHYSYWSISDVTDQDSKKKEFCVKFEEENQNKDFASHFNSCVALQREVSSRSMAPFATITIPKVQPTIGSDEDIVFSEQGKFCEHNGREWLDKGQGLVSVIVDRKTNSAHLIMLLLNGQVLGHHNLVFGMSPSHPLQELKKQVTWSAIIFASQKSEMKRFMVKFDEENTSVRFMKFFNRCVTYFGLMSPRSGEMEMPKDQYLFSVLAKFQRHENNGWIGLGVVHVKVIRDEHPHLIINSSNDNKILADHRIESEIVVSNELDFASKNSWTWSAMDYSGHEARNQMFNLQFFTKSSLDDFKNIFDKFADREESKDEVNVSLPTTGFGDAFKIDPNQWECEVCCVYNKKDAIVCIACQTPNKSSVGGSTNPQNNVGNFSSLTFGSSKPKESGFTFGDSQNASGFSFGGSNNTSKKDNAASPGFLFEGSSNVNKKVDDTPSGFTFGGPSNVAKKNESASSGFSFDGTSNVNKKDDATPSGFSFGGSSNVDKKNESASSGFSFDGTSNVNKKDDAAPSGFSFRRSSNVDKKNESASSGFSFGGSQKNENSAVSGFTFGGALKQETALKTDSTFSGSQKNETSNTSEAISGFSFSSTAKDETAPKTASVNSGFFFGGTSKSDATTKTDLTPSGFTFGDSQKSSNTGFRFVAEDDKTDATKSNEFSFQKGMFGSNPEKSSSDSKSELGGFMFSKTPVICKPNDNIQYKKEDKPKMESGKGTASPFSGFSFMTNKDDKKSLSTKMPNLLNALQSDSTPSNSSLSSTSPNKSSIEEYEPNIDFKPTVPLPDLIDAKTGEENEEKLFGNRAKLYRYDTPTQQWKEKGIGEIKILKLRSENKFRILMRREQVLKLCANHYINKSMSLLTMDSSDRAWVWCATDYSDEEVKNEKLAVKFKTGEIAKEFKSKFDECLQILSKEDVGDKITSTSESQSSFGDRFKPAAGSWECSSCFVQNSADQTKCIACTAPKDGSSSLPTNSLFDKFDSKSSSVSRSLFREKGDSDKYKLGSPENYKFNFGGMKPVSPTSKTRTQKTSESHDEVEPSNADDVYFQPLIPLPPQITVNTGEEDEELLYSHRAKLLRMVDNEWKERGIGDIKVLHKSESSKVRLVMRREHVLKLCCNHYLLPDTKFLNKDNRSVMWCATDYAEETAVNEKFVLRFKNGDILKEFLDSIEKAKSLMKAGTSSATITSFSTSLPTPEKSDSSEKTPEKNALNSFSFKLDDHSEQSFNSAKGQSVFCSTPVFSFGSSVPSTTTAPSSGFVFGTNSINIKPASDDIEVVFEKKSSPEEIKRARELFLPDNFFTYQDRPECSGCRGCEVRSPFPESKQVSVESSNNVFGSSSSFSNSHGVSFADLVGKTSGFQSSNNENFKFAGAGSKLFMPPTVDQADESGETEENHDPHFEPIIPLPEKINVVTGEEEETVLFSHRCKLYRFDNGVKQWKERGIGEIKILEHTIHPDSFRILFRREQVYKLACNHNITSDMQLAPMASSSKAWCWVAMDYSDGDGQMDKFAVKFKDDKTFKEFKDKFDGCVDTIQKSNQNNGILFSKKADLSIFNPGSNIYEAHGFGKLVMDYNEEVNGYHISFVVDGQDFESLSHMVSTKQELVTVKEKASWSALDFSVPDSPVDRKFQVTFLSMNDAALFKESFIIAKDLAKESNIHKENQFCHDHSWECDSDADDSDETDYMFYNTANIEIGDSKLSYQPIGVGEVCMFYDGDNYGIRMRMKLECGTLVCDHLIAVQTSLRVEGKSVYWCALDSSDPDHPVRKFFKVTFSEDHIVNEFEENFSEGKKVAIQSGTIENEHPE